MLVVACCCCILLQLALMLVLAFTPFAGVLFLPLAGANTPLACVVIITHCNLCWWCFSFQPLVHILHLYSCNSHCMVVVACDGGIYVYSTCTYATYVMHCVVVVVWGGCICYSYIPVRVQYHPGITTITYTRFL